MDVKICLEDGFFIALKKRGWTLYFRQDRGPLIGIFQIPNMEDGSIPSELQARQDAARYLRWIADIAANAMPITFKTEKDT